MCDIFAECYALLRVATCLNFSQLCAIQVFCSLGLLGLHERLGPNNSQIISAAFGRFQLGWMSYEHLTLSATHRLDSVAKINIQQGSGCCHLPNQSQYAGIL